MAFRVGEVAVTVVDMVVVLNISSLPDMPSKISSAVEPSAAVLFGSIETALGSADAVLFDVFSFTQLDGSTDLLGC